MDCGFLWFEFNFLDLMRGGRLGGRRERGREEWKRERERKVSWRMV
jgi:hypothetical protein